MPNPMQEDRIRHAGLRDRVVSAEQAAALIKPGETVAMSGFTGSGYPKAVPLALAAQIEQAHADGLPFQIKLMTGASTAPELDGALAKADAIARAIASALARAPSSSGAVEAPVISLIWNGSPSAWACSICAASASGTALG